MDAVARNGLRYDYLSCWVARFRDGRIVEVRAVLDSARVAQLITKVPVG